MRKYIPTFEEFISESDALDAYIKKNKKKPKKIGKFEVENHDIVLIQTPNPDLIVYGMLRFNGRKFSVQPMKPSKTGWVLDDQYAHMYNDNLERKELKELLTSGEWKIIDNFDDARQRGEPLNRGKKIR